MRLFDRIATYTVHIDDCALTRKERETSSGFTRYTTTVSLKGNGCIGRGEDVTYDQVEHDGLRDDLTAPLTGQFTVESAFTTLDGIDLFPAGNPDRAIFRNYRRWGFESAVLDLALKQAEKTVAEVFSSHYKPVRFVVSTKLGDPPNSSRLRMLLELNPSLEFKVDVDSEWSQCLLRDLRSIDRLRILDFKGQYRSPNNDPVSNPDYYQVIAVSFPNVLLEDPVVTTETREIIKKYQDRLSWDAPSTGIESIEELPWDPQWVNIKPSRFGSLERLLDCIEYCREQDITMYGGGQFELGVGRNQIQALASLFYPDSPNDVAPGGYNVPVPDTNLPPSPLIPQEAKPGFGWSSASL